MKKLLFLAAALATAVCLGLLPFEATDVAKLIPAQTVLIMKDGTQYTVDVGAGVRAVSNTLKGALDALQEQTSGTVYFDTCEQLLLMGEPEELLPQIADQEAFRPAADVYTVSFAPEIGAVSAYLENHHGGLTVSAVKAAAAAGRTVSVPKLVPAGGGYRIVA